MGTGKGRRVAIALGTLGVAVLVGAGVAFWERLLEPHWLAKLSSEAREDRVDGANRLGRIRSIRAIPKLVELFEHESPPEMDYAEALCKIGGPALPALVDLVRRPVPVDHLALIGTLHPEIAAPLGAVLRDGDAMVRRRALDVLEEMGAAAAGALPDLIHALEHHDMQGSALTVLGNLDPPSSQALPPIIALLHGASSASVEAIYHLSSPPAPYVACEVLKRYGEPALLVLLQGMQDGDQKRRGGSAFALGRIRAGAERILPALERALGDAVPEVRAAAAGALGDFGSAARRTVPDLRLLLGDPALLVRLNAAKSLVLLAGETGPVVPFLIEGLNAEEPALRWHAARALGKLGAGASEAVPALVGLIPESVAMPAMDFMVGVQAIESLGNIGPAAKSAIPRLEEYGRDMDWVKGTLEKINGTSR